MKEKKGLFVVFEGIDGSGKSTQINYLAGAIQKRNKYQDILLTREPTWRATELRERLRSDGDAFSEGERMAYLFVEDRKIHTEAQILPALQQQVIVLCDRYSLSTCAYQSAQGVSLDVLCSYHENAGILTPDIVFYVDVSRKVAEQRMMARGLVREKFEKSGDFTDKLIKQYRMLAKLSQHDARAQHVLGKILRINGEQSRGKVTQEILLYFTALYDAWIS